MKCLKKTILIIFLLFSVVIAKTQQEEYKNDILYSQEYFDYLIECASIADFEAKKEAKEEAKKEMKEEAKSAKHDNEINFEEELIKEEEVALDDTEPFKLRIENSEVKKYKETIKKEDTKTTLGITDKFSIVQDTLKFKNKYNSDDFRLKTGVEYALQNNFILSSGLETNFRGQDQNPISKKLYFSPTLKFNDKFSISFINKIDTMSKSTDYDVSFNVSPFKSKVADFNIYAGYTLENNGVSSESINLRTNFYFF